MSQPAALFPNLEQTTATNGVVAVRKAVLLVEDDEPLSDLLKHLLKRMQVPVLHASTGAGALKTLADNVSNVSLAFVDCHLPDSEGGELCRQLRAMAPKIPLLLTSGRDQRALEAIFSEGGPCSFLAKPYMPAEVMGRVKSMLTAAS